ncbi:MAG: 4-(cytidine 5'-diphospho)-2-C-methyl-D-erythritol kinase [Clostridia bacterium]|nr:4-(cytidine 5'-diphospho)-2-C-methyl-D-erythritol kinase [Clostridia bacterium]
MEKIYVKARAKVNLCLSVLEKNKNGYHNLDSVFQKINFYDELWLEKIKENKLILESDIKGVKLEDNIIYKAYYKLIEEIGNFGGVKVKLKKNIPMQAGLAGGSTDCASFLIAINKLYNLNIEKVKLKEIAKSLGADVVPCMFNGAVLSSGIGDIIKKINTRFKYYFLIIKPKFSCNTAEMFKELDKIPKRKISRSKEIINALETNNFKLLSENLINDFELVLEKKQEFINIVKVIQNQGAKTLLAGSGSCVFGIFLEKQKAKEAYNNLKNKYEIYICTSYNLRRNYFGNE